MVESGSRIEKAFQNKGNDKVMSLFITAGYPGIDETADLILGFEKNGAEIIELGMPFSDPLADGPTIQHASNTAISNGITMEKIFDIVREVRESSEIPLILMGYINPVLAYGVDKFCRNAADAGADGLIIPDAPIEESAIVSEAAKEAGLDIIHLVAPNTTDERMAMADRMSSGFVYCVSVTGVTGAREGSEVAKSVERFIHRVNENVKENPKMVGFGIKTHEDAQQISKDVDGFIVGSALVDNIRDSYPETGWKENLFKFVRELKHGNENDHQ